VKIRISRGLYSAESRGAILFPASPGFENETHSAKSASCGWDKAFRQPGGARLNPIVLGLAVALAVAAGFTDWRSRRIPNWLTVPGFLVGVAVNAATGGLHGLKTSLLGGGLGLLVLLPFVLLRSLGAGDWKLAGALGAFVGWEVLLNLLIGSVFVAGIMALGLAIYKQRFIQTMRNIGGLLASMVTLHRPGPEVSLDNPQSLKIPYGVALALTTLLFGIGKLRGTL
jgi:prepilin peptidase CpaA